MLSNLLKAAFVFAFVCGGHAQEFEDLVALAESYDDDRGAPESEANRDLAVQYYQQALAARPEHPDNMKLEYHVIQLLMQMDPSNGDSPRYESAFTELEAFVQRYEDAPEFSLDPAEEVYAPSVLLPRAAIHAGDLSNMLHQDAARARGYYEVAMRSLAELQDYREQSYSTLSPPAREEFDEPGTPEAVSERRYQAAVATYERRMESLANAAVLPENSIESDLGRNAVKQFAGSFKNFEEAREELVRIATEYAGTPMAQTANDIINSAKNEAAGDAATDGEEKSEESYVSGQNASAGDGGAVADTDNTISETRADLSDNSDALLDNAHPSTRSYASVLILLLIGTLSLMFFLRRRITQKRSRA